MENNPIELLCAQALSGQCIILDGSNISHRGCQDPRLAVIEVMQGKVRSYGANEVITFVDPTLIYKIPEEEKARMQLLLKRCEMHQSPKGTKADNFILQYAAKRNAIVISNDLYEDYPLLRKSVKLLRFMILPSSDPIETYSIQFNLDDLNAIVEPSPPTCTDSAPLPHIDELFEAYARELRSNGVVLMSNLKPTLLKVAPDLAEEINQKGRFRSFLDPFERLGFIRCFLTGWGRMEVQWCKKV